MSMVGNHVISESIGECWKSCVDYVIRNGVLFHDEDVNLIEILGLSIKILFPDTSDEIVNEYGDKNIIERTLLKFSKDVEMRDRPFTYGERIFNKNGVDQFEWLISRIKKKMETKSATICLLIEGEDLENLPCLTTIDFKIREEKLDLQFFFRSQNIFGRQYANLLALAKLQQDLACRLHLGIGFIGGYIASAHIYDYDLCQARLLCSDEKFVIEDKFYYNGPKSIREAMGKQDVNWQS